MRTTDISAPGLSLQAVNNTTIATYITCSLLLDLGFRSTFRWVFINADISKPILGADFLKHYVLLVDIRSQHLQTRWPNWRWQDFTCYNIPHSLLVPDATSIRVPEDTVGCSNNYTTIQQWCGGNQVRCSSSHCDERPSSVSTTPTINSRTTQNCLPEISTCMYDGAKNSLTLIKQLHGLLPYT